MAKTKTIEDIIKEIVFREVHNHEVNTARSLHPVELEGVREILRKNGKIVMGKSAIDFKKG